jgi:AcrR family transcriptional regulator
LRPDDGRLERGRRSRARIRDAARALFREEGFDKATLRSIASRAGMGASSIYRHVETKHELLILELTDLQEEAWLRFRQEDERSMPTRWRIHRFFDAQHALLADEPDLTVIALRAISYPQAGVSRRVLALHDRSIGLLTEILQQGRGRDLDPALDVLSAAPHSTCCPPPACSSTPRWVPGSAGPTGSSTSAAASAPSPLR